MYGIRKLRIKLLSKCLAWVLPICLLAYLFFINIKYSASFLVCFILTCFFVFVPVSIYDEKFNSQIFRNRILPKLRKDISKSISYDKNNNQKYKPIFEPVNKGFGEYFHRWSNIHNVLTGNINGVGYKIADTNTSACWLGFSYISFNGQIIELDLDKDISAGKIIIKPQKIYNEPLQDGLPIKNLDLKKHVVYTNDCIKNDDVFLKIKNFVENYNKKMYIKIEGKNILIMIDSNTSLSRQFSLFRTSKFDYENINMIFNLIQELGS